MKISSVLITHEISGAPGKLTEITTSFNGTILQFSFRVDGVQVVFTPEQLDEFAQDLKSILETGKSLTGPVVQGDDLTRALINGGLTVGQNGMAQTNSIRDFELAPKYDCRSNGIPYKDECKDSCCGCGGLPQKIVQILLSVASPKIPAIRALREWAAQAQGRDDLRGLKDAKDRVEDFIGLGNQCKFKLRVNRDEIPF